MLETWKDDLLMRVGTFNFIKLFKYRVNCRVKKDKIYFDKDSRYRVRIYLNICQNRCL